MNSFDSIIHYFSLKNIQSLKEKEIFIKQKLDYFFKTDGYNLDYSHQFYYDIDYKNRILDIQLSYFFTDSSTQEILFLHRNNRGLLQFIYVLQLIYLQNITLFPFTQKQQHLNFRKKIIQDFNENILEKKENVSLFSSRPLKNVNIISEKSQPNQNNHSIPLPVSQTSIHLEENMDYSGIQQNMSSFSFLKSLIMVGTLCILLVSLFISFQYNGKYLGANILVSKTQQEFINEGNTDIPINTASGTLNQGFPEIILSHFYFTFNKMFLDELKNGQYATMFLLGFFTMILYFLKDIFSKILNYFLSFIIKCFWLFGKLLHKIIISLFLFLHEKYGYKKIYMKIGMIFSQFFSLQNIFCSQIDTIIFQINELEQLSIKKTNTKENIYKNSATDKNILHSEFKNIKTNKKK